MTQTIPSTQQINVQSPFFRWFSALDNKCTRSMRPTYTMCISRDLSKDNARAIKPALDKREQEFTDLLRKHNLEIVNIGKQSGIYHQCDLPTITFPIYTIKHPDNSVWTIREAIHIGMHNGTENIRKSQLSLAISPQDPKNEKLYNLEKLDTYRQKFRRLQETSEADLKKVHDETVRASLKKLDVKDNPTLKSSAFSDKEEFVVMADANQESTDEFVQYSHGEYPHIFKNFTPSAEMSFLKDYTLSISDPMIILPAPSGERRPKVPELTIDELQNMGIKKVIDWGNNVSSSFVGQVSEKLTLSLSATQDKIMVRFGAVEKNGEFGNTANKGVLTEFTRFIATKDQPVCSYKTILTLGNAFEDKSNPETITERVIKEFFGHSLMSR